MTVFTPLASFIGGTLIGLSAVLLLLAEGRIAGISGIASRLFPPYGDRLFPGRLAFIVGLVAAPVLYAAVTGEGVVQTVSSNRVLMAVAGLLVGFGSVWGSGCTSAGASSCSAGAGSGAGSAAGSSAGASGCCSSSGAAVPSGRMICSCCTWITLPWVSALRGALNSTAPAG